VKVIQASIATSRFPVSWSHTLIRPILKPGKNAFHPASYRPIALLCTDYKIFTSIISSRMKPFLPDLFPEHQTGYISGRSTHHAALRFAHLLNTTKDAFPLLLDSEKAYDRVSHEDLDKIDPASIRHRVRISMQKLFRSPQHRKNTSTPTNQSQGNSSGGWPPPKSVQTSYHLDGSFFTADSASRVPTVRYTNSKYRTSI